MTDTTTAPSMGGTPQQRLLAALVEAQRLARGVEKDARNDHMRYAYASTEGIILESKDAMSKVGLALVQCGTRMFSIGTRLEDDGKGGRRETPQLFLATKWRLVHEGGATLELEEQVWPACPEKGRPLDKAIAAASTSGLGYLLRNVLMLARVEEGTDLDSPREGDRPAPRADPQAQIEDQPVMASSEQREAISKALEAAGVPKDLRAQKVAALAGHASRLTYDDAERVIASLKAPKAGAKGQGALIPDDGDRRLEAGR